MKQNRPRLPVRSINLQFFAAVGSVLGRTKLAMQPGSWIYLPLLAIFGLHSVAAAELRSLGYVPVSEAEFASFPKTKHYRAYLPESVDLSSHFPAPGDQGKLNACTAWAVGYAARSYYAQAVEGRERNKSTSIPSPSFIYNSIRDPRNCDSGSEFPDALRLLEKGSLSLADFPYSATCTPPDSKQSKAATDFKIANWLAVDPKIIDDIKGEVAHGQPVMFGMLVDANFQRVQGAKVYSGEDRRVGGHAMTVVGYDDRKQALKIINSWGTGWGDDGFGWIAYDTFRNHAREAYVMHVAEIVSKPEPKPITVVPEPPEPVPKPIPRPEVAEPIHKPEVQPPVVVQPVPRVVEEPIVASDCSRVVSSRAGDKTIISGYVGTEAALEQVRQEHQGSKYQFEVQFRPWPQCEVLMTLETALRSDVRPQVMTKNGQTSFKNSDQMAFEVMAPSKPAYIYVSYVQADGSVVHLQQPSGLASAPSLSAREYLFGDGLEGRPKFIASAPFGREMVVVLASASPLFEERLPTMQTEREYLSALRKAIIYKADPKMPDREISATFLGIETKEK